MASETITTMETEQTIMETEQTKEISKVVYFSYVSLHRQTTRRHFQD